MCVNNVCFVVFSDEKVLHSIVEKLQTLVYTYSCICLFVYIFEIETTGKNSKVTEKMFIGWPFIIIVKFIASKKNGNLHQTRLCLFSLYVYMRNLKNLRNFRSNLKIILHKSFVFLKTLF